jgi:hypothetical protein
MKRERFGRVFAKPLLGRSFEIRGRRARGLDSGENPRLRPMLRVGGRAQIHSLPVPDLRPSLIRLLGFSATIPVDERSGVDPERRGKKMNDEMARLGRMIDEALSGSDTESETVNEPASIPRTASLERFAPRVLGGPHHQAVEDVCWIYRNRYLAENLRRFGWREARRRVLSQGALEAEWVSHRGRPPVRLTRGGVEVKLPSGVETLNWKRMQSQVRARRS